MVATTTGERGSASDAGIGTDTAALVLVGVVKTFIFMRLSPRILLLKSSNVQS